VSSVELTKLYLERLHRFNEMLNCVVTFTDDLALRQAAAADREMAAGHYRGPLHGIPWGAKDLIAYPPYKTTWGAPQFKDQVIETKATVARRLDQAGAVLLAKLSLGALAWGDEWFGGKTRNPWNPEQGSSGSSAGSAAATAAGLAAFTLGSETLGSIVSPCRRCGTTGLRPTFGRVSRHGCMALAWSMDKIGPITRSVEDCALILDAIHGADGEDPTAVTRPFHWPSPRNLASLRVGYFESRREDAERPELDVLRSLGVQLVAIQLPQTPSARPISVVLNTEAATIFDELLRTNNVEGLNRWPNAWRQAQFVPAVEYLRANRARSLLMQAMQKLFADVDLYVGGNDLVITNLTGHPTVVLPNGFRQRNGLKVPTSITFTGKLFGESELMAVAYAYQQATGHHLQRPPLESFTQETNDDDA
jgi:Asp-tRNA(Asn)/Glu-tRNA(Gln) amidotransferase A subunit family amidase